MLRIFQLIQGRSDPAIDLALAAALPTATPATAAPIVEALLERRRMPAAAALIEQYHRLSPTQRAQIAAAARDLTPAIRRAAAATRSPAAENALDLIEHTPLPSLTYLVTGILRHGDADRRAAAAKALLALTRRCTDEADAKRRLSPADAEHVVAGVAEAVTHLAQHREPAAVTGWLLLSSRRIPKLEQVLEDPEHPATRELGQRLYAAATPIARRALLPMLIHPVLHDQAAAGLRRAAAKGYWEDVLRSGAVLRRPEVAAAVGGLEHAERLWPEQASIKRLTAAAQRALADWACCLPGEPMTVIDRLNRLTSLSDEAARAVVLRRLLRRAKTPDRRDAAEPVIAGFGEDASERLALIAVRHVMQQRPADLPRHLARWCNSPHPSVAELAEARLAPIGFQRLWDGWPSLPIERRLALGRVLIKIDPRFHATLAERLSSKQVSAVERALSIIATLGQGAFFLEDAVRLARSPQPRVAATAVSALGAVGGDRAARALIEALDRDDARVRANAVEALARPAYAEHPAARAALQRMRQMTRDQANRPRANAIHAVLRLVGDDRDAAAELDRMLDDTRPEHRLSAVWLVESEALVDRAARLAEMAVADRDQRVQARARRAFERMLGLLRPADAQTTVQPSEAGALAKIGSVEQAAMDRPTPQRQGAA
ncbi:MAG: hypothetical protein GVY24_02430 [Planctomycetes bacterium]|jgi:hypothetical protein|nr:hypothetical protein [Planctomycetota bacterium]